LADSIWVERLFRTLFGTKSRHGRDMETSGRGNEVSRVARIKHGEDGILLGRREEFHDGGDWKERSV
ncbi:hypothetical protein PAXRUDRAFT_168635, partial [Paxillus rubicundulus Ve08.2h10]